MPQLKFPLLLALVGCNQRPESVFKGDKEQIKKATYVYLDESQAYDFIDII